MLLYKKVNKQFTCVSLSVFIRVKGIYISGKILSPFDFKTQLQSNLCTTVTLGKWHGDRYKQGDRCIQVNFVENIRQLKILGSCQVTALYRAVIYRFDCNRLRPVEPEEDILTSRFSSNLTPSD